MEPPSKYGCSVVWVALVANADIAVRSPYNAQGVLSLHCGNIIDGFLAMVAIAKPVVAFHIVPRRLARAADLKLIYFFCRHRDILTKRRKLTAFCPKPDKCLVGIVREIS